MLQTLRVAAVPLCDDCASTSADILPRQQVHQIASRLAGQGLLSRSRAACSRCGRRKITSAAEAYAEPATKAHRQNGVAAQMLKGDGVYDDRPWSWEGNVQATLKAFLQGSGWTVTAEADTESQQRGVDLAARRRSQEIFIEVKGFPTTTYARGARRGQSKPTLPTNQARQWFSHALLSMMRLRGKHPAAQVALCFPDHPTYRNLLRQVRGSLELLGAGVYLVKEDGDVDEYLYPAHPNA